MANPQNHKAGFGAVEIVLVLAIVGLVGAVGWFAYKNYQKPKTSAATTTVTKPVSAAAQTANPYTGWKTYTSPDGISFKYPPSWTLNTKNSPYLLSSPANSQTKLQFNFGYSKINNDNASYGNDVVTNSLPLGVSAAKPLYVLTLDFKDSTGNDIDGLYVTDSNAVKGAAASTTTFATKSGGMISFYAILEPSNAQNNGGQTLAAYQSNPDYKTVVDVFKSLSD